MTRHEEVAFRTTPGGTRVTVMSRPDDVLHLLEGTCSAVLRKHMATAVSVAATTVQLLPVMLLGRKLFALTTAPRLWWFAERDGSSACCIMRDGGGHPQYPNRGIV